MKKLPALLTLAVISAFFIATNAAFLWIILSKKAVAPPKIPTRATEGPAYLTFIFGRSQWADAIGSRCRPLSGARTLEQVAIELKIRGDKTASSIVITDWPRNDNSRLCRGGVLYSNWNDLTRLRDSYGWTMLSGGLNHTDLTSPSISSEQITNDVRDSLSVLEDRGHTKGWSLYAYSDNHFTPEIQRDIVSLNYAYGRTYTYSVTGTVEKNRREEIGSPWFQKTNDVLGGKCNSDDHSLPCYTLDVRNERRYLLPENIVSLMQSLGADEWLNLQFFLFVEGRREIGEGSHWNCEGNDTASRKLHWTDKPELYCWNDFRYVLENIPSIVQVVTPDVVATAWGRTPPFNLTPTPTLTATPSPTPTSTPTPTPSPTPAATALKEPMRGVISRDGMAVEAYRQVANGFVVNVRWSELQTDPPDSLIIHPNPIDNALVQLRAWNSTHDPDLSLKIRLFTTTTTPTFWSSNREVGGEPILFRNPATGRSGYIGRFWTSSYKQAYDSLQTKLAEEYDDEIEIKDVTISRCMLVFAEPFSRYQTSTLRSNGWNETVDRTCHREAIDAHRAWTTTRSSLALNPEGPWREMLDYCRLSLGQRCILENNSLRSTSQGASYENLYSLIQAKGPPIIFQTATSDKIGSWQTTLQKAISYGANAVELNSGYTSYDLNELRDFDLQLEANPIDD